MTCLNLLRPARLAASLLLLPLAVIAADAPPSAVGPLLGILQKGTLPPERVGAVAKMVCERGNEHDLAYIFSQIAGETWPVELRRDALGWLEEASATRKLKPAGDLSGLATLIASGSDARLQRGAVELAGEWKVAAAAPVLQKLASEGGTPRGLRDSAIDALIAIGGETADRTIQDLLRPDQPAAVRIRGVAALAAKDAPRAAALAAEVLQSANDQSDPAPLMDAFLNIRGGADQLAAAITQQPLPEDVALLSLRHLYAVGRSDPSLDAILSKQAGINAEAPKLTEDEIKALAATAQAEGDALRGEQVFRRSDLACFRCHALSKAGGQIGPDLSAVGASSPVDYLVKSIYDPDAQKKEEFLTRIILTTEGQQFTGIVANRTDDKLVLKTAEGKHVDIAAADIDFEADGKSLMPEGLVKFMTRQEVLDVVKFLSMLGKPDTPWAIRSTQRMQRWRVLKDAPENLLTETPNVELFGDVVLNATTWEPAYARVNGELPLPELTARTGQQVVYVQGEVEVTAAGPVVLRLDSNDGVALWVDDESLDPSQQATINLEPGRHAITLRVDTTARQRDVLRLEVRRAPQSKVQFTVVDGQ